MEIKGLERHKVSLPAVPVTMYCSLRGMHYQQLTLPLIIKYVGLQSYVALRAYRRFYARKKDYKVMDYFGYIREMENTVRYERT